jgi:hypothetical protein
MQSSDDEAFRHLCRLKKAQLNVLHAENDRLRIHIVRKKASIARLNLEQSLLQDQLNTAGTPHPEDAFFAHDCRIRSQSHLVRV